MAFHPYSHWMCYSAIRNKGLLKACLVIKVYDVNTSLCIEDDYYICADGSTINSLIYFVIDCQGQYKQCYHPSFYKFCIRHSYHNINQLANGQFLSDFTDQLIERL